MKEGNNHEITKIFLCVSKLAKAGWNKDLGCQMCRDLEYCKDLLSVVEKWLEKFNPKKHEAPST